MKRWKDPRCTVTATQLCLTIFFVFLFIRRTAAGSPASESGEGFTSPLEATEVQLLIWNVFCSSSFPRACPSESLAVFSLWGSNNLPAWLCGSRFLLRWNAVTESPSMDSKASEDHDLPLGKGWYLPKDFKLGSILGAVYLGYFLHQQTHNV